MQRVIPYVVFCILNMPGTDIIPDREMLDRAADRVARFIHRTPVLTSSAINSITACSIFFKCENFQKVGAFKYRGATNAVQQLSGEQVTRGVATHSSGNHAAALALAAGIRNIPAYIVMPETAPSIKKIAVTSYGAHITFCEPTLEAREETLAAVLAETGAAEIHPYNDYRIIAGQSTAARELFEDIPDLDIVMTPVGGGGLLSGTALAAHFYSSNTKVIAAEPRGADDAARSFRAGRIIPSVNPVTVADGLLTSLGDRTFAVITRHVHDIVTVDDASIIAAMRLIWERMKIVVEASAAVPLAAILGGILRVEGKRVGIILSGGNCDLERLPWLALSGDTR
jgi:threonine dehydratase